MASRLGLVFGFCFGLLVGMFFWSSLGVLWLLVVVDCLVLGSSGEACFPGLLIVPSGVVGLVTGGGGDCIKGVVMFTLVGGPTRSFLSSASACVSVVSVIFLKLLLAHMEATVQASWSWVSGNLLIAWTEFKTASLVFLQNLKALMEPAPGVPVQHQLCVTGGICWFYK